MNASLKDNTGIYFDNNATTQIRNEVLEFYSKSLQTDFANSSSSHLFGQKAQAKLTKARANFLQGLGAQPDSDDLIFTSGATESNHLAILGFALGQKSKCHFITQKTEHSSVLEVFKKLNQLGHDVSILDVDQNGHVNAQDLKKAILPHTSLVSIMMANNEVGTVQNLKELSFVVKNKSDAFFHSDAAQTLGKLEFSLQDLSNIDLMSFSAHKLHGPKGIGALFIKNKSPKIHLQPQLVGGGHEFGLRSGTVNLPAILAFEKALALRLANHKKENAHILQLQSHLQKKLKDQIPDLRFNGCFQNRLPGNLSVTILGVKAEDLIIKLPNYAFSTGSACSEKSTKPSHVLLALGLSEDLSKSTIRLGLSYQNTMAECDAFVSDFKSVVASLRSESLEYEMFKKGLLTGFGQNLDKS